MLSRRNFGKLALTAAFGSQLASEAALSEMAGCVPTGSLRPARFEPWIEVRADHIRQNVCEISKQVGGRPIMAVLKNNAYGLGLVDVARVLETEDGVEGYAIVALNDAVTIRKAGLKKSILFMGPYDEQELETLVELDVIPAIYTQAGETLDRIARKTGKEKIAVHLYTDTGMGRTGVPYRSAVNLARQLAAYGSVHFTGMMMTFTEDPAFDHVQFERFTAIRDALASQGIDVGLCHAASSHALYSAPYSYANMVRPGVALFGLNGHPQLRDKSEMALRPAAALRARVAYIKTLGPGESAGYERSYRVQARTDVATLHLGHMSGIDSSFIRGGKVRIGSDFYPAVMITANHLLIELGETHPVKIGDTATIFDWEEGSRPDDIQDETGFYSGLMIMRLSHEIRRVVIA